MNPANHQPYGYMIVKLVSKEAAGQRDLSNPACSRPSASNYATAANNF